MHQRVHFGPGSSSIFRHEVAGQEDQRVQVKIASVSQLRARPLQALNSQNAKIKPNKPRDPPTRPEKALLLFPERACRVRQRRFDKLVAPLHFLCGSRCPEPI